MGGLKYVAGKGEGWLRADREKDVTGVEISRLILRPGGQSKVAVTFLLHTEKTYSFFLRTYNGRP